MAGNEDGSGQSPVPTDGERTAAIMRKAKDEDALVEYRRMHATTCLVIDILTVIVSVAAFGLPVGVAVAVMAIIFTKDVDRTAMGYLERRKRVLRRNRAIRRHDLRRKTERRSTRTSLK